MILIAGIPSEEPVAQVIESADNLGIEYILFNQREAMNYELNVSIVENKLSAEFFSCGRKIDLCEISGIYFRMMDIGTLPENSVNTNRWASITEDTKQKLNFNNLLFCNLTDILPCRVLNRPSAMESNFSKLYQLWYINNVALGVPDTIITNEPEVILEMKKKYGEIIFKSISSVRSIVKPLENAHLERLSMIKNLPTQFQKCLKGNNIRVHVVGDTLLSAKILSDSIDYRYAHSEGNETDMQSYKLPKNIEKKCFELSKKLNLPLCGIDLFETVDGDFFCFEINPSPGYSYFQSNAQLPISDAIVKYLEYGTTAI
jgi:glutathione synthase/RimK-type ligase-like ATP-grasp enzyme